MKESGDGDSATSLGLVKKLTGQVSVSTRYEVVRQIAQGGMGTILRVWDDDLRRNLAMKVLHARGVGIVFGDDDAKEEGDFGNSHGTRFHAVALP